MAGADPPSRACLPLTESDLGFPWFWECDSLALLYDGGEDDFTTVY